MESVSPTIAAAVLVALSLWIQCAGMATLINWGLTYLAHKAAAQPGALHCTHVSGHQPDDRVAPRADSGVGGILSLDVFSQLGVRFLLLDRQLFHDRRR